MFHEKLSIHGTVYGTKDQLVHVPTYVINHGLLDAEQLNHVLKQSNVRWVCVWPGPS